MDVDSGRRFGLRAGLFDLIPGLLLVALTLALILRGLLSALVVASVRVLVLLLLLSPPHSW